MEIKDIVKFFRSQGKVISGNVYQGFQVGIRQDRYEEVAEKMLEWLKDRDKEKDEIISELHETIQGFVKEIQKTGGLPKLDKPILDDDDIQDDDLKNDK